MIVGQPASVTARQHGREELDADHEAYDQVAEAELVVNEQRNDRQRQANREIAAEESSDNPGRRPGR
jgi:hypothetical protein